MIYALLFVLLQSFRSTSGVAPNSQNTEYLQGAKQFIYTLSAADGNTAPPRYIVVVPKTTITDAPYLVSVAPTALIAGDNVLQSEDGKSQLITIPQGLGTTHVGDNVWVGQSSTTDVANWKKIGTISAEPGRPLASSSLIMMTGATTEFYIQGDKSVRAGLIPEGSNTYHMFACGSDITASEVLKSSQFHVALGSATTNAFLGKVELDQNGDKYLNSDNVWYKVTVTAADTTFCTNGQKVAWIGGGTVDDTAGVSLNSVIVGVVQSTITAISTDTTPKIAVNATAEVTFVMNGSGDAQYFLAGCHSSASNPAVVFSIDVAANTGVNNGFKITKFGGGVNVASKALNVLDPTGCIVGRKLYLSNQSGENGSWTEIATLAAVPKAADTVYIVGAKQAVFLLEQADGAGGVPLFVVTGSLPTDTTLAASATAAVALKHSAETLQSNDLKSVFGLPATATELWTGAAGDGVYVGNSSTHASTYVKVGTLSSSPPALKAAGSIIAVQTDAGPQTDTEYYFQSSATNGVISAGTHMFACGYEAGELYQRNYASVNTDATVDAFPGTVTYVVPEDGTATATTGANNAWYKVTFTAILTTMSTLCDPTADPVTLAWVGGGTADVTADQSINAVKLAVLQTTPSSKNAVQTNDTLEVTTDASTVTFTTAIVANSLNEMPSTYIARCSAAASSTVVSTPFRATVGTIVDRTAYTITQFGETAGKKLSEIDPTYCIAGNVLVLSDGAGGQTSWVKIATIVPKPLTLDTEYLIGAKQAVILLNDAQLNSAEDIYITVCTSLSPVTCPLAPQNVHDSFTQSSDNASFLANLSTGLWSGSAGNILVAGTSPTDQTTYVQIGTLSAAPNKPAAQSFTIDPKSTSTEFLFQGDATAGAIAAGTHLFACGTYAGSLMQVDYNLSDAFAGTVSYTNYLDANDAHALMTSGANSSWVKVTFAQDLRHMSSKCSDGNEFSWVGGGTDSSSKVPINSVKLADLARPVSIAEKNGGLAVTRKSDILFGTSDSIDGVTIVAGCATTTGTPAIFMQVTYAVHGGQSGLVSYKISQVGIDSTKNLEQLDPVNCIVGNRFLLSSDAGASWTKIGTLVSHTDSSGAAGLKPTVTLIAFLVATAVGLQW